jgi:hypothetical protein
MGIDSKTRTFEVTCDVPGCARSYQGTEDTFEDWHTVENVEGGDMLVCPQHEVHPTIDFTAWGS